MTGKPLTQTGLRIVAIFELVKAIFLLVVGCGLLSLINQDASVVAESVVRHLHLNPYSHYPRIFIEAASNVTNTKLLVFASLVALDSILRGIVAYGLWWDRRWGKWLGVAAAAVYIPLELYSMTHHATLLKFTTIFVNVLIVIYLGYSLRMENNQKEIATAQPSDSALAS